MNNNKIILYLVIVACVAPFILFSAAFAQDDIKQLQHDIFVNRERPAAVFPHTLHSDALGIDCLECHHIYKNGENVWDESELSDCTGCHSLKADGKKMSAMRAFHTNCKNCHLKENKGPVTCGECHPKKK
ncbi:MAG: cytochrome c family protein [Proteobacteria bacterium]|nr:cytochrome c3 family protein [Desulfobacteraceae bacterium]MBU3980027.1 cytochrome c family protein [Pseudomonadota bacterium]MBU4012654.1 cytochrome c family protein [Pseudomonadota bacterium]MBU4066679.1 cytochrome c family protein [Pseudomonadota bacterium]MBU4100731.1 cytochrome c family protein [Pseudomonadota bacterium]